MTDAEPVVAMPEATAPSPAGDAADRSPRTLGAAVGVTLGAASLAVLWLLAATLGESVDVAILELVAGPDGILSLTGGAPFIWLAPLLAAAIAGWTLAPRAVARRAWAGWLLGWLAYVIGILVGTLIVLVLTAGDDVSLVGGFDLAGAYVGLVFLGSIVLAPLLLVCVVGGVLWAAVLRTAVPPPVSAGSGAAGASIGVGLVLGIGSGFLLLLWAAAMWVLDALQAGVPAD